MGPAKLLSIIAATLLTVSAFAAEDDGSVDRALGRGEAVKILRPEARTPKPVRVSFAGTAMSLMLNSDGLLTISDLDGPVNLVISAGDKTVRAHLAKGQMLTAWVVRDMVVSANDGLALDVKMSSWAFALRADRAGPAGLVLVTDDGTGTLYDGQRVDSVKSPSGEVRLARSGLRLPGDTRRERARGPAEEEMVADAGVERPGPPRIPSPQALKDTMWIPGATIPLPGLALEVIRPDVVSP